MSQVKSGNLRTSVALSLLLLGAALDLRAAGMVGSEEEGINQDVLSRVMTLYGLDEDAAIGRLAAEVNAADTYRLVQESRLKGYAGAWFDAKNLRLNVAISEPEAAKRIESLGAHPVMVKWSLDELDAVSKRVANADAMRLKAGTLREVYVDYPSNRVVVAVAPQSAAKARTLLAPDAPWVTVVESAEALQLSSGTVRGADGTRNASWATQYGGVWPCSIGASVNGGYVTAGHCGSANNQMTTPAGVVLGTVRNSTLPYRSSAPKDSAFVETVAGWVPGPYVNGYSNGLMTVTAKWSGTTESPVGATVCRYGATSSGPHCGTINAKNLSVTTGIGLLKGVVRVTGTCTNAGDSGGPFVAAGENHIQGTVIGGTTTNTCPTPTTYVYYQPIFDAINLWGKSILTAHGAVAPTVTGFQCASPTHLGPGTYRCQISHFNSQGATSMQWNTSQGHSSIVSHVKGSCTVGQSVNVTLTVSNSYGSTPISDSVTCLSNQ